jgi:hypothetical protein
MQNFWIYEPVIPCYELLLFHNAMSQYRDACSFFPVAVAKRCEMGTKYRYLCLAKPEAVPDGPTKFVIIELYKPEMGAPYVTQRLCVSVEDHV